MGLVAAGLALLLPLVTLRLAKAPAWTPRYAMIGIEAAIGIPACIALMRTNARRCATAGLAFCAVAALSTAASDNPSMSFFGMDFWGTGCLFIFAMVGMWAIGTAAGRDGATAVERAIVVGVLANATVAVVQLFFDLARFGAPSHDGQPTGLLGQPIALGELLLAGLWLIARRAPVVDRRALVMVAATALGLEVAGERLPILLLPLVVAFAVWRRPARAKLLVPLAVVVGLAAGFALNHIGTPVESPAVSERLQTFSGESARVENYLTGVHAFAERPLLGWGPGRYQAATSSFRSRSLAVAYPDGYFADAHDMPLQYAVTTGLVGLAAFGAWLLLAGLRSRGALLGFALIVLIVQLVQPQDVIMTPLALLALGAAAPVSGVRRVVPVPVTSALVIAATAFAALVLIGGYHEKQASQGSLDGAIAAARTLPHWPDRAMGAASAALTEIEVPLDERLANAVAFAAEAGARDTRDARTSATRGFVELVAGNQDAARARFDEAMRLDPYAVLARTGQGVVAQRAGDTDAAIDWFRQALAISPNDPLASELLRTVEAPSG